MTTAKESLDVLFIFDPAIGFFNRESRGRASQGSRAGYLDTHGYRRIVIEYKKFYEHHLIWLYVHNEWPNEIDHKDGDRSNNAINNLRKATRTQNNFNRSMTEATTGISGLRGAYWNPRTSSWFSKIQIDGQTIWLGTYESAEIAHAAYKEAADILVDEYALHNRDTVSSNKEAI